MEEKPEGSAAPGRQVQFSLMGLGKFVTSIAVASACIAPAFHWWRLGAGPAIAFILFEACVLPLAMAGIGFLLLQRGPRRTRFILAAILLSVLVALGSSIWILRQVWESTAINPDPQLRVDLKNTAIVVAVLGITAAYLAHRSFARWKAG